MSSLNDRRDAGVRLDALTSGARPRRARARSDQERVLQETELRSGEAGWIALRDPTRDGRPWRGSKGGDERERRRGRRTEVSVVPGRGVRDRLGCFDDDSFAAPGLINRFLGRNGAGSGSRAARVQRDHAAHATADPNERGGRHGEHEHRREQREADPVPPMPHRPFTLLAGWKRVKRDGCIVIPMARLHLHQLTQGVRR